MKKALFALQCSYLKETKQPTDVNHNIKLHHKQREHVRLDEKEGERSNPIASPIQQGTTHCKLHQLNEPQTTSYTRK